MPSTPRRPGAATPSRPGGSSSSHPIDLTFSSPSTPPANRGKRAASAVDVSPAKATPRRQKKQKTGVNGPNSGNGDGGAGDGGSAVAAASPEKRLRRFRTHEPSSFDDVYHRALTQRFYVLKRTRAGTEACPEEVVEMTGSTGNIYTVRVGRQPSCDCPHALKGNQCKHVIWVLAKVLNAPHNLVYQLALLSTELQTIFAKAPPADNEARETETDGRRKPVEGDCPICFSELESSSAAAASEAIVWCRAACGQNLHRDCFRMWARTRGDAGSGVTCPFCRSVWQEDGDAGAQVRREEGVRQEGYVNVADQLGIDPTRDMSSYSEWWDSSEPRRRRPWFHELQPYELDAMDDDFVYADEDGIPYSDY